MSIKHINLIKSYSSTSSIDNLVDRINNNNNNDDDVLQDIRVQQVNINNLNLNIHRLVQYNDHVDDEYYLII